MIFGGEIPVCCMHAHVAGQPAGNTEGVKVEIRSARGAVHKAGQRIPADQRGPVPPSRQVRECVGAPVFVADESDGV